MKIMRLTADSQGGSRWDETDIAITADGASAGAPLPASAVIFGTIPPGLATDWHPSPFRGLVITLSGEAEHEASDGTRRRFGPGGIFLAEDTTGSGHRTRSHTSQPTHGLIVSLPPAPAPEPVHPARHAEGTRGSASAPGAPSD